jgi:type II restriction enzyme
VVKLEWYRPLGLPALTEDAVRAAFLESLLESNRAPSFFVDWGKVHRNVDSYRASLAKLAPVYGSSDPRNVLVHILQESPGVAPVLPLLAAWRATSWKILQEENDGALRSESLDLSGTRPYSETAARNIAVFCERAGVLRVLHESQDLGAYLLGIEAGMDTNARKNRSGQFMEARVDPHIKRACAINPSWKLFSQKKFLTVREAGVQVPTGLLERKFDYAIIGPPKPLSIEVNYYDKEGSKPQEIVDSYIQRSRELRDAGWIFAWITDGPCWKGDTPQIRKAFAELDAVLSLDLCRRGVLDAVLGTTEPPLLRGLAEQIASSTSPRAKSKDIDRW